MKIGKKFPTFKKLKHSRKCNYCKKLTEYALNHESTRNTFCSLDCFDQFYLDICS